MDAEKFEKIKQRKTSFLLALEELRGGSLDVEEMKKDYELLLNYIDALRTANLLLHDENQEYEKILSKIAKTTMSMGYASVLDLANDLRRMAREVLPDDSFDEQKKFL